MPTTPLPVENLCVTFDSPNAFLRATVDWGTLLKNKDDWGSLKKEFYRNGVIFFLKTRPKMIRLLRIRIKIVFSHCLNLAQRYFSSFNQ